MKNSFTWLRDLIGESFLNALEEKGFTVVDIKKLADLKKELETLHRANKDRVQASILRALPLQEAAYNYTLEKVHASDRNLFGALEMAFIQGANWERNREK